MLMPKRLQNDQRASALGSGKLHSVLVLSQRESGLADWEWRKVGKVATPRQKSLNLILPHASISGYSKLVYH